MQERFRDSITEIAHLINLFKNLDEMCNEIIKLISTFLDIKVVFLCIFDEYNKSFKVTSHIGLNEMASSHGCSFLNDLHTNSSRCNSVITSYSIHYTKLYENELKQLKKSHVARPIEEETMSSSSHL